MLFLRFLAIAAHLSFFARLTASVADGVLIENPSIVPTDLIPECSIHCWDNTKYVTACVVADEQCLCSEEVYGKIGV